MVMRRLIIKRDYKLRPVDDGNGKKEGFSWDTARDTTTTDADEDDRDDNAHPTLELRLSRQLTTFNEQSRA